MSQPPQPQPQQLTVKEQIALMQKTLREQRRGAGARTVGTGHGSGGRLPRNIRENGYFDPESGKRVLEKLRPWHERVVDMLISRPGISQKTIAKEFQVTEAWLSTVMSTDMFQEYYRRRSEAHSTAVTAGIVDKTQKVARAALEVVERKLANPAEVSITEATAAGNMALRALGFGGRGGVQVTVNNGGTTVNQSFTVTESSLLRAREALKDLRARNAQVVDQEQREVFPELIEGQARGVELERGEGYGSGVEEITYLSSDEGDEL